MATINSIATADRLGVNLDDISELVSGRATANVAQRLGLTLDDVDTFIVRGSASRNVSEWLGLHPLDAVDELGRVLDRQGRIGLLVGALFAS